MRDNSYVAAMSAPGLESLSAEGLWNIKVRAGGAKVLKRRVA